MGCAKLMRGLVFVNIVMPQLHQSVIDSTPRVPSDASASSKIQKLISDKRSFSFNARKRNSNKSRTRHTDGKLLRTFCFPVRYFPLTIPWLCTPWAVPGCGRSVYISFRGTSVQAKPAKCIKANKTTKERTSASAGRFLLMDGGMLLFQKSSPFTDKRHFAPTARGWGVRRWCN